GRSVDAGDVAAARVEGGPLRDRRRQRLVRGGGGRGGLDPRGLAGRAAVVLGEHHPDGAGGAPRVHLDGQPAERVGDGERGVVIGRGGGDERGVRGVGVGEQAPGAVAEFVEAAGHLGGEAVDRGGV